MEQNRFLYVCTKNSVATSNCNSVKRIVRIVTKLVTTINMTNVIDILVKFATVVARQIVKA